MMLLQWVGAGKLLENAIEVGFQMVGIGLGVIAMEWIETESKIGEKKGIL